MHHPACPPQRTQQKKGEVPRKASQMTCPCLCASSRKRSWCSVFCTFGHIPGAGLLRWLLPVATLEHNVQRQALRSKAHLWGCCLRSSQRSTSFLWISCLSSAEVAWSSARCDLTHLTVFTWPVGVSMGRQQNTYIHLAGCQLFLEREVPHTVHSFAIVAPLRRPAPGLQSHLPRWTAASMMGWPRSCAQSLFLVSRKR